MRNTTRYIRRTRTARRPYQVQNFRINYLEIRWLYEQTFNERSPMDVTYDKIGEMIRDHLGGDDTALGLKRMKEMLDALRAEEATNPLRDRKFIGE